MPSSSSAVPSRVGWSRVGLSAALDLERLSPRAKVTLALSTAALCALAMAATWILAALVPATHLRDAILLYRFIELGRPGIDTAAGDLLELLNPLLYTIWALLIVAVALLRRRPRTALAVTVVLPAAPGIAEVLKPLLAHRHASVHGWWVGAASWPSGHATAAATLVLCALLVAPRVLRPTVAALGGLFVAAVGVSLLILAWHMPSDVLGGYLLAALCVSLAAAALSARSPLSESGPPRSAS
jgi:membrane-associated phospholipid phosphatase